MLFNSVDFAIFITFTFFIYWFIVNKQLRLQNLFVIVASYFFYGWWDWRFLFLILISTIIDFIIGQLMTNQNKANKRKALLIVSILTNLGILGFFKYFNFFLDSLYSLFPGLLSTTGFNTLQIILPVGISFYTFQTLSYSIDIYKGKVAPTKDIFAFAAFVAFFPQLVAGPIERASNLLPQFQTKRQFDYSDAIDGLKQILWGLFKKIVIADNCAIYANLIFNSPGDYNGSTLFLGAIFFSFQIYGDFSGYSDIAIGTSRLFGFKLMQNFSYPYFSRNIGEFWRRWHISLSTWFRDYLYIPLGGSRGGVLLKIRNIFIIFIVSGFWHGANWTFVIWGLFHAILFLPPLITKKNRQFTGSIVDGNVIPSIKQSLQILFTFGMITFAWIFFRANDLNHAGDYISGVFSRSLFTLPEFSKLDGEKVVIILTLIFLIIEWMGKENKYAISQIKVNNKAIRYSFYYILIAMIFWYGGAEEEFIYFQF